MGTEWLQIIAPIAAVLASSGFWAYMMNRRKSQSAEAKLLRGLAYDKILTRGEAYLIRGWISMDEFEEYQKYLFAPYKALGGNGMADRVMEEIARLPLRGYRPYSETVRSQSETKEMPSVKYHPRHAKPDYADYIIE